MPEKTQPPRLFTYIIPVDDGAAPNPFYGMCSLAICKPAIRRVARVGDWVAGVGAISRNLQHHLVYAMRVERVLTLEAYDQQASTCWPERIPDPAHPELARRLGDCIYDFSALPPEAEPKEPRPSVHGKNNVQTDLGGRNVLLASDEFYYFGREAVPLPSALAHGLDLRKICPQGQGHRSTANAPYVEAFVAWLKQLGYLPGQHGWPDFPIPWLKGAAASSCCAVRACDDPRECD